MVRLVSEKIQENKKKRKKTTTSSSTETNRSMELHGFLWVEVFLSGNHSNKEKSKTHNLSFLFSPTRQGVRKQRHTQKQKYNLHGISLIKTPENPISPTVTAAETLERLLQHRLHLHCSTHITNQNPTKQSLLMPLPTPANHDLGLTQTKCRDTQNHKTKQLPFPTENPLQESSLGLRTARENSGNKWEKAKQSGLERRTPNSKGWQVDFEDRTGAEKAVFIKQKHNEEGKKTQQETEKKCF